MLYDLIIIGGGPAATAAGVYAARKKLKALLLTESIGGQSEVSTEIQNWIGVVAISGFDLAKSFETHLKAQEGLEIVMPETVTKVAKAGDDFTVETASGKIYEARAVIVAPGARRKKLGIPGEEEFNGKGVVYCSTCDAPLFSGKDVAVIGGGNAGLEAAIDLLPYAKSIVILEYADTLKGDPVTVKKLESNEKIRVITGAQTLRVEGAQFVERLTYKDCATNEEKTLNVGGVFVEIGSVPNSEMVKGFVELNKFGEVVIDHRTSATSVPGIFSAGDVTNEIYKQNNISAGDAVKATLSAYNYLLSKGHEPR